MHMHCASYGCIGVSRPLCACAHSRARPYSAALVTLCAHNVRMHACTCSCTSVSTGLLIHVLMHALFHMHTFLLCCHVRLRCVRAFYGECFVMRASHTYTQTQVYSATSTIVCRLVYAYFHCGCPSRRIVRMLAALTRACVVVRILLLRLRRHAAARSPIGRAPSLGWCPIWQRLARSPRRTVGQRAHSWR